MERLFHACLAREGDTDIAGRVSPFRKVNGYPSDFKSYLFDRLQLLARQRDVRYLLGQVQAIAQCQKRLERNLLAAEQEVSSRGRIARAAGFSAGIALALLVI